MQTHQVSLSKLFGYSKYREGYSLRKECLGCRVTFLMMHDDPDKPLEVYVTSRSANSSEIEYKGNISGRDMLQRRGRETSNPRIDGQIDGPSFYKNLFFLLLLPRVIHPTEIPPWMTWNESPLLLVVDGWSECPYQVELVLLSSGWNSRCLLCRSIGSYPTGL